MKEVNIENFYILTGVLVNQSIWKVSLRDLKAALDTTKNVYIVDIWQQYASTTFGYFEICDYLQVEGYEDVYLPYTQEEELVLSKYDCKLLLKFHHTWFNEMYDYLHSKHLQQFTKEVNELREEVKVFPEPSQVFNVFSTSLHNIKCALISGECYKNEYNNGYAISTYKKEKPPTFLAIQKALKEDNLFFSINNDLIPWITQGMFLYNYQTTSHHNNVELTRAVIQVLNRKSNFYWFLLGSNVFHLKELINTNHFTIFEQHPIEYMRRKETYLAEGFKQIKEHLNFKF